MNKGILWVIKIFIILIVFAVMTSLKEAGVPVIAKNIIGFAIIYAVWKYNPEEPIDEDRNRELDKS